MVKFRIFTLIRIIVSSFLLLSIVFVHCEAFSFLVKESVLRDFMDDELVVNNKSYVTFNGCVQPESHCVSWKYTSGEFHIDCSPNPQCGDHKFDITWHGDALFGGSEICFRTNMYPNSTAIKSILLNPPLCFYSDNLVIFESDKYMSLKLWKDMCYQHLNSDATIGDKNGNLQKDGDVEKFFWKDFSIAPYIVSHSQFVWPMYFSDVKVKQSTTGTFAKTGVYTFYNDRGDIFMVFYSDLLLMYTALTNDNQTVISRPKMVMGVVYYIFQNYNNDFSMSVENISAEVIVKGKTVRWEGELLPHSPGQSLINCDTRVKCSVTGCEVVQVKGCNTKFTTQTVESWINHIFCFVFETFFRAVLGLIVTLVVETVYVVTHSVEDVLVSISFINLVVLGMLVLLYIYFVFKLNNILTGTLLFSFCIFVYIYALRSFPADFRPIKNVYYKLKDIYYE